MACHGKSPSKWENYYRRTRNAYLAWLQMKGSDWWSTYEPRKPIVSDSKRFCGCGSVAISIHVFWLYHRETQNSAANMPNSGHDPNRSANAVYPDIPPVEKPPIDDGDPMENSRKLTHTIVDSTSVAEALSTANNDQPLAINGLSNGNARDLR